MHFLPTLYIFSENTAAVESHETSTAAQGRDVDAVECDISNTGRWKNSSSTYKGISPGISIFMI